MSTTRKSNLTMAVVAAGILAIAAVVPMANAGPEGKHPDGAHAGAGNGTAAPPRDCATATDPERCRAAQAKMEEARAKYQEKCDPPANETAEKRCKAFKEHAQKGFKARREAHALMGAIEAHERILGRVDYKIEKLEQRKEAGNLTANETARIDDKLERLQAMHDRQVAKIDALHEKLEALKAKWAAAREHAQERRAAKGSDDDDAPEGNATAGA